MCFSSIKTAPGPAFHDSDYFVSKGPRRCPAVLHQSALICLYFFSSFNSIKVADTRQMFFPSPLVTRQSPMIRFRPFLKTAASARSTPWEIPDRKLLLSSIVVKPSSGASWVIMAWAIDSSASATIRPPCMNPAPWRYSGRIGIVKHARPALSCVNVMLKESRYGFKPFFPERMFSR